MSDDIFWPPLSGHGDGDGDERNEAQGQPYPTQSYPTEPLATEPLAAEPLAAERLATEPLVMAQASHDPNGSRRWGAVAAVGVVAFVFGGGGIGVGAAIEHSHNGSTTPAAASPTATLSADPSALTTSPKSYAGIAARVLPSVVSINVTSSSESDTGSGIILRSNGYILTNNHVVAAAATGGSVSVTFNDGSTAKATIVGTDQLDDLAVIKVAKTGLTSATLGNSSTIQVGDPVLAVGSPLGLTGTVTAGIVSALNRPVETQAESTQSQTNPFGTQGSTATAQPTVIDAIQTDAAINPGNSGGALVDAAGQVIGINSAIASLGDDSLEGSTQSGSIGVGFAIPVNEAKTISNELIATGQATHPLLGVELKTSTTSAGANLATIASVTAGGPADKAGLKQDDVITAINGTSTPGADAVIAAVRSLRPGQQITVTYERGGVSHTVTATLSSQPTTSG